jgi:spore coat polysaccharide biosynthesis protein SpsF
MPVAGRPLLARVVERAISHAFIDEAVVVTSTLQADDPVEAYCNFLGIKCIRGHETDVFQRYVDVAKTLTSDDVIVRITADNCFSRSKLNQQIFTEHIAGKFEYSCVEGLSHLVYEYINVTAFLKAWKLRNSLSEYDREHVTPFFRREKNEFILNVHDPDELGLRKELDKLLTIDTLLDLKRVEALLSHLNKEPGNGNYSKIYHWLEAYAENK